MPLGEEASSFPLLRETAVARGRGGRPLLSRQRCHLTRVHPRNHDHLRPQHGVSRQSNRTQR